MKKDPTTYAMTTAQLLHAALTGNRDAQRVFEGKYGNPEVAQEDEFDEEARLDTRDRVRDMHSAGRL